MAYVKIRHRCHLPMPQGTGDLWECDECDRLWRSHAPGNPDCAGWRRVGPIGRWIYGGKP